MATETWMTPIARERLEVELAELERASGGGAGEARARILELRALIRSADAASKPDDGLVEPGMKVTLRFEEDGSTSTFLLGSRVTSELDSSLDIDVYSPTSPLGSAITGHHAGEMVSYAAPSGEQRVTILAAAPFSVG